VYAIIILLESTEKITPLHIDGYLFTMATNCSWKAKGHAMWILTNQQAVW